MEPGFLPPARTSAEFEADQQNQVAREMVEEALGPYFNLVVIDRMGGQCVVSGPEKMMQNLFREAQELVAEGYDGVLVMDGYVNSPEREPMKCFIRVEDIKVVSLAPA